MMPFSSAAEQSPDLARRISSLQAELPIDPQLLLEKVINTRTLKRKSTDGMPRTLFTVEKLIRTLSDVIDKEHPEFADGYPEEIRRWKICRMGVDFAALANWGAAQESVVISRDLYNGGTKDWWHSIKTNRLESLPSWGVRVVFPREADFRFVRDERVLGAFVFFNEDRGFKKLDILVEAQTLSMSTYIELPLEGETILEAVTARSISPITEQCLETEFRYEPDSESKDIAYKITLHKFAVQRFLMTVMPYLLSPWTPGLRVVKRVRPRSFPTPETLPGEGAIGLAKRVIPQGAEPWASATPTQFCLYPF